jgi:segregation and condensation protein B
METQELKRIVEALIFAADEPLGGDRIAETLELENGFDLNVLVEELNQEYSASGRSFTIRQVAGGYQIVTQQNYASWIRKLYLGRQKNRLSHAALETLALIAFKQPISRVDIAQIRGVNSDGVIGTLLERKLVAISGRSEAVGRPLLYSTTPEFLKYFGINDIADLPKPREIEELFSKEGMPEELLQALSQTDAQLSLPITADGETSFVSEDAERKDVKREDVQSEDIKRNESTPLPLTETPTEVSEIQPTATIFNSEPVGAAADDQEVATVLSTPENASIDINDRVFTLIDDPGATEPSSRVAASENENEIAWISLDGDTNNPAEHFTGSDLSVDDLTEISTTLQNTDSTTKVITDDFAAAEIADALSALDTAAETKTASIEATTEDLTTNLARTDAVLDSGEDATTTSVAADVGEIVETALALPFEEIKIVEVNDVGLPDFEPPELKADSAGEIDGWVAEEFSNDEIAEPDFVQKAEDFFLEDVSAPHPESATANELEENPINGDPEPIVNVTIVNIDEPTIVEPSSESMPVTFDDAFASQAVVEAPATPAAPHIASMAVQREELNPLEAPAPAPDAIAEVETETQTPAVAATMLAEAMAPEKIYAPESPALASEDARPATFRARVMGWIKRTFDKFISLIGAKI